MRESSILAHLCQNKKKWLMQDEPHVVLGFKIFQMFYESTMFVKKSRTYEDYMKSSFYDQFNHFAQYAIDLKVVNPMDFAEFLIKNAVPIANWELEFVYDQYVKFFSTSEDPCDALERTISIMQEWESESGRPLTDYFSEVNPFQATRYIKSGRISPWVLYCTPKSADLLKRLNEEQVGLIEPYMKPIVWEDNMMKNRDTVKVIKTVLKELGF